MIDVVRKHLSETIDAVATKRYSDLRQIDEFVPVAKALRISRILRTLDYGGQISETLVYKDAEIFPLYNKKYECENDSCRYAYEFYTDIDFATLSPEQEKLFEHVTHVLAIICTCTLSIHVGKLIDNIDRDSGIPNSKGFRAFIEDVKENGVLSDYAVIRANIKGCNTLNTIFGYQATTEIIAKYAKMLNKMMYNDEICSRSGSDNFCLMVKKSHLKNHLKSFAKIPINFFYGKEQTVYEIAMRAGIVVLDGSTDDIDAILARAESCIDVAKRRTDTDYVYYDLDTITREQELTLLESDMPQALADGEFIVYYQPKVRIETKEIFGAEALVRWHRKGRLSAPVEFIPLLTNDGSIIKLDYYVLEEVCKWLRKRIDMGFEPLRISVNFSRKHLEEKNMIGNIVALIDKYELDHQLIEIELTESEDYQNFELITEIVNGLRANGIVTSMDDFGTGFSSLNMIKNVDLQVIKIDKSFIPLEKDYEGKDKDLIMFYYIIKMVKKLGKETIAEGVETEQQLDYLREVGCDAVQGFVFDKPLPAAEFEKRLACGYN